ncbi:MULTISPECIES: DUF6588 family protein [Flavobacterium]|uniref:DUF6588 family protein n=1 Tax=Flavobacterium jumunjinense TaxID=998845 RepID=A0ABV5GI43_9FLAO|nr:MULTISPECIES: DUF6588 family protein [Flavobacterium]
MKKIITCFVFLLAVLKANAQAPTDFDKIGYLLSDALLYSEQYILPITDAAVYQSSSAWVLSPKKKKVWDVTLGIHTNIFFVPKKDREFTIKNSDFQFFEIEGNSTATVPSALGNDDQVYLTGEIGGEQVRFETPEGVNQESIIYPYLQASVELPLGFEFTGRYSTRTKLKKGYYQVYGAGLKYNISQHFLNWKDKNIHLAIATIYSKEDIGFDFLDINTAYGNLGINQINGKVDTWHFNVVGSKEFNNFELIGNFIVNNSKFEYLVSGPEGSIEGFIPVQAIINDLLKTIEKDKVNYVFEISGIYHINKLALQSSFAFGKFANLNLGVQYKF